MEILLRARLGHVISNSPNHMRVSFRLLKPPALAVDSKKYSI